MPRKHKSMRKMRNRANALRKFENNNEWMDDLESDELPHAIFATAFNMGWTAKARDINE